MGVSRPLGGHEKNLSLTLGFVLENVANGSGR